MSAILVECLASEVVKNFERENPDWQGWTAKALATDVVSYLHLNCKELDEFTIATLEGIVTRKLAIKKSSRVLIALRGNPSPQGWVGIMEEGPVNNPDEPEPRLEGLDGVAHQLD